MSWRRFKLRKRYSVSAKVFEKPSRFGIRKGRVSKLEIRTKTGKIIVNYDRGWDIRPKNPTHRSLVKQVLNKFK